MSDLPPIGSLWLHRESGERRFVVRYFLAYGRDRQKAFRVVYSTAGRGQNRHAQISDWLSWAAHADRIDKEEA